MTSATQTPKVPPAPESPEPGGTRLAALRAEVESLREVTRHSPQRSA